MRLERTIAAAKESLGEAGVPVRVGAGSTFDDEGSG